MIGVAYNVFDGEELLEPSIMSIRKNVGLVVVVYQDVSNFGNRRTNSIKPLLDSMVSAKLIDVLFEYVPDFTKKGHGNEINKRQIGLNICRSHGCTHFISMDCDEFYKSDQFDKAARIVMEDGYESSACMMQTYYKDPTFALDPPETYYVPFIYKIDNRNFELSKQWPVVADPTRKMNPGKIMVFSRNVVEMHHYSYCRTDIRAKLINSSASVNFKNRIDEISKYHDAWTPGMQAMLAGREKRMYDLVKVENYFNITI